MDLHKKIIGNAISSYFLIFVSISFLWSKAIYINHPFVKSHVKTAFSLHILLALMLFLMGFNIGDGISLFGIMSLNDAITAILGILISAGIFYGAYRAHLGQTVTLGEIFHKTGIQKDLFHVQKIEAQHEEQNTFLILAHVPFFGFIISGQHPELPHIRDISQFHLISMSLVTLLYIFGHYSLANIIFLAYIIWSIIQALRLSFQNELTTVGAHFLPTPEEKYILIQSLFSYLFSTIHAKKDFISFQEIKMKYTQARITQKTYDFGKIQNFPKSKIPDILLYIPILNLIALFSLKTRQHFHIQNGLVLSILFIVTLITFGGKTNLVLLFLFPLFCGIGKLRDETYRMPYIHDVWEIVSYIIYHLAHLFRKTRELQKKQVQETLKIRETEKTPEA